MFGAPHSGLNLLSNVMATRTQKWYLCTHVLEGQTLYIYNLMFLLLFLNAIGIPVNVARLQWVLESLNHETMYMILFNLLEQKWEFPIIVPQSLWVGVEMFWHKYFDMCHYLIGWDPIKSQVEIASSLKVLDQRAWYGIKILLLCWIEVVIVWISLHILFIVNALVVV